MAGVANTTKPVCKPRQLARDSSRVAACRGGRNPRTDPPQIVDRAPPLPVYFQIANDVRRRIDAGEWSTGERIAPELALAREYEVSRVTVRQALAELVKDDLLERRRGSGTYVRHQRRPLVYDLNLTLGALATRWRDADFDNRAEVIEAGIVSEPSDELSHRLQLRRSDGVLYLLRRVFINDRATVLYRSWISSELVPGLESSKRLQRLALDRARRGLRPLPDAQRERARGRPRDARGDHAPEGRGRRPAGGGHGHDLPRRTATARALAARLARRPRALPRHRLRVGSGLPSAVGRASRERPARSGLGQREPRRARARSAAGPTAASRASPGRPSSSPPTPGSAIACARSGSRSRSTRPGT